MNITHSVLRTIFLEEMEETVSIYGQIVYIRQLNTKVYFIQFSAGCQAWAAEIITLAKV